MGPSIICVFNLLNSLTLVVGLFISGIGLMLAFLPGVLWAKIYRDVKANAAAGYTIPESAEEFGSFPLFLYIGLAFLVFGGLMAIASFMAFLGARCVKNCCKKLLVLYAIIVGFLILIEVTIGIMLYVSDSSLHDQLKSNLKGLIEDTYQEDGADAFSKSLNLVHRYYDCCGMDNADDFGAKDHSSCDTEDETKGCYSRLQSVFDSDLFPVGLGLFTLIQVISVYCAVSLYKQNKVEPVGAPDWGEIPGARATTNLY